MNTPSMMIYLSSWEGYPTFKMMPVTKDCPFVEALYDPRSGTLAVIGVNSKEGFALVDRLDKAGQAIPLSKNPKQAAMGFEKDRKQVNQLFEYYIQERQDIKNFVTRFAVNPEHHTIEILDVKPYFQQQQEAEAARQQEAEGDADLTLEKDGEEA